MDIEKLIERYHNLANRWENGEQLLFNGTMRIQEELRNAANTLSTLQAENTHLRYEVERQRRSADDSQHLYENAERAYIKAQAVLEQVKRERDAAIKTIFQWTGCPECKWWNSVDEWCEKHDREADSCGGCDSPEWRGPQEE